MSGDYRIIDRRGQSAGIPKPKNMGYGLFQTPRNSGQADYYRPRLYQALDGSLPDYDWRELVDYSRQLFSQNGNLGYAVIQKAMYAVGDAWIPQYTGDNRAWGDEAEEWLQQVWLPQSNLVGGAFDWQTDLFVSSIALDVDGDDLCIFTVDENDFPKLNYRPSHDIKSGAQSGEVKGGPFDGAKICNGVIHDRNGRFMGVRIVGDDGDPQDIPALNCHFNFEPEWRSQKRGIPRISKAILDCFDVDDIKTFMKRGIKLENSIGLLHYNEGGEASPGSDIITERSSDPTTLEASDVKIEKRLGGEVMYFRAGSGDKIEAVNSSRPHPNTEAFLQRLERRGLLSLGWFYELLDPAAIGGASVRLIQDEARHSVASRQKSLIRRARRSVQFAVSQGMSTGRISENTDAGDFLKWGFGMPAQITVDAGYDEQADRENMLAGTTTLDAITQKKGRWWENVRKQRKVENIDLIMKARELMQAANSAATAPDERLTLREAISLMQAGDNAPQDLRAGLAGDTNSASSKEK